MVIENLLGHLQDRTWWKVGEIYLLVVNAYDHRTTRLDIEYTFVANGRVEVRRIAPGVQLPGAGRID